MTNCDALILSDLHLGSKKKARPKAVRLFFEALSGGRLAERPGQVILNGDVLEDLDFRRWPASHWEAFAAIRAASARLKIVWVVGNHDGPPDAVTTLAGPQITVECERALFPTGATRCVVAHGHDKAVYGTHAGGASRPGPTRAEVTARLQDQWVYKKKTLWEAVGIARGAVANALELRCGAAVCSHSHSPFVGEFRVGGLGAVRYANTGSWTSGQAATYVVASDGDLALREFASPQREPK